MNTFPLGPVAGRLAVAACALVLACAAGCSDAKGHRVSGKVTFKGAPVPAGKIYFTPDASKKNDGQPGYADIKDGEYDTSAKGSQGTAGGPTGVRIEGRDATGKVIFQYATSVELPVESTTKDFEVPDSAANNVAKTP